LENIVTGKPRPLVLAAAVSAIIVSLLGAVAISLLSRGAPPEKSDASAPKKRLAAELTVPMRDSACASCGTVEAVRAVELKGNPAARSSGGAGDATIGNYPGASTGNAALTVSAAAGGAVAGNEIEKTMEKRVSHRVTVHMDDGSFRTVSQSTVPTVAVGDRVRIANGALVAGP
jgi:outer membrane lipoprotein SlyB